MSIPLYNRDILRLAASIPQLGLLDRPDGRAERRSPACGSRVVVDVALDGEGCVRDLGLEVKACALGQAAAALLSRHARGASLGSLERCRDDLAAYLEGARDDPGSWPGLEVFAPARPYPARHASILLPFEAAVAAVMVGAAPPARSSAG